jgi:hypothetical protein
VGGGLAHDYPETFGTCQDTLVGLFSSVFSTQRDARLLVNQTIWIDDFPREALWLM